MLIIAFSASLFQTGSDYGYWQIWAGYQYADVWITSIGDVI